MDSSKHNSFPKFSHYVNWKFMDTVSQETSLIPGVPQIIIITLFLLIVAIGIIMLVLVYQKKQLQYLREKEQLKVAFEKEILESKLEIQEQTLKNISQEIHDNIGQILSLAKLTINTMNLNEQETLQEKINDSKQLIGKAIQDLRDLSRSLDTDYVTEMGLIKSIEYEFQLIKKTGNYETNLIQEGNSYRLSPQQELILFRIFQEVMNNIIKHAKASSITVNVHYLPGNFLLQIKDNGQGFDISLTNIDIEKSGSGIKNMQNRSRLIGATFDIESEPAIGTTVKISLPLL